MHVFDEMKAYVGFDAEDERLLRDFLPRAQPEIPRLIDAFYAKILATPAASAVLTSPAQVERLKATLRRWMDELLAGPWDADYLARRERIGRVHVQVGLPSRFMFTAMTGMREGLCDVAFQAYPCAEARRVCAAITRISEIDLAIMTGTYMLSREERQLTAIQELIVSHMPVTVLLIDRAGCVSAATRPGIRLFGTSDLVGRPYQQALPATLVAAAELPHHVDRALETRREIALTRVDVTLDGEDRAFRLSIVPLNHETVQVLLYVEELTEAVQTEARLQRAETLAQLGALSAAVAHELRNPLAGISGVIQVLLRSMPEDDRRREVMQKVDEQLHRLNALVTDLLAFAKPQKPRPEEVDLARLARSVCDLLRPGVPDATLEVVGEGRAVTDANIVSRIVMNLVQNALQAVPHGVVRVTVSPDGILVNDSGPGIPPEMRARIWEPFFTTRTKGTGLGLAICRKSAAELGGQLTLTTGELPGAAFWLTLG